MTPGEKQAVNTTATASITEGDGKGSISLERCSSGIDQEKACAATFTAKPPGIMTYEGFRPGYVTLRLWHSPGLSPALHVAASHSDKKYERLGRRTEEGIVEAVTFSGSTEVSLGKGFTASGVRVLVSTPFLDAKGGNVPAPSYSHGKFTTREPAYGTLVVEYTASYTAYRVYYGLPDWVAQKIFSVGGALEDFTIPPVLVMAFDKGASAAIQLERKIMQVRPPDCKDDEWLTDAGESTVVKYKIFSEADLDPDTKLPKPGANHLTAVGYVKHVEYCKQRVSRIRTQNYPVPDANNIEIISISRGSI
ncbi:MAG: hypothetical protein OEZ32_07420 [Nitrospinota bacterium]|nr:hypothetical protein [Nitrospinota bacterium]